MYQDGDEVWFCSTEANIYRFEAGRFLPYLFEPDHIPGRIWCLFKYSQQRFWVGSRDVVYCYDDHQRTRVLTSKDGLIHDTVRAICEDGHGHIWFGAPHGVSAYDEQSFVNYTTENGLSNNEIWHLYCDSKHRIWISTFSGGTTCYDGPSFFSYTPDDGLLEDSVNQVFEVRAGNDWFSHNTTGLSRFEPHCFEVITADPVAEGGFSRDPAERLWYGSFSKLGLPNGDRLTSIQMPAPINAILNDRQGGLWVGTYGPAIYESRKNEVFRAVARAEDGDPLQIHHFSPRITTGNTWRQDLSSEQKGYTDAVNQFRKQYIANVLHECNGNRSETAKRLKMHRPNLIALVKKFGIE